VQELQKNGNKKMNRSTLTNSVLLPAIILVGCGGGGGGSSTEPVPTGQAQVAITETNKKQVASAALRTDLRSLSSFGGGAVGAVRVDSTSREKQTLMQFVKNAPQRVNQALSGGQSLPSAIIREGHPIPCGTEESPSGSFSVKFNDIDGNGDYGVGESVEIVFDQCLDGTNGTTSNGKIKFSFTSLSGFSQQATPPWSYTASWLFSEFELRSPGATPLKIDGTMVWSENQIDADENLVMVSGTQLNANRPEENLAILDFAVKIAENSNISTFRQFGRQAISSSKLGGSFRVDVAEIQPLAGSAPGFPDSGAITISGNRSSLTLTAVDRIQVRVDLDANMDGVVESSDVVNWSDLNSF
jgi:hypothetical protein